MYSREGPVLLYIVYDLAKGLPFYKVGQDLLNNNLVNFIYTTWCSDIKLRNDYGISY